MHQVRIYILLLWIILPFGPLTAQVDFAAIETEIITTVNILKQAQVEQDMERQILFSQKLEQQLLFVLVQPGSFYYPFPSLQHYITINHSEDYQVRCFSWVGRDLGWRYEYKNLVQYMGKQQFPHLQWLSDYDQGLIQIIIPLKSTNGRVYGFLGQGDNQLGFRNAYFGVYSLRNYQFTKKEKQFGNLGYLSFSKNNNDYWRIGYSAHRHLFYYWDENNQLQRWYWTGIYFRKI